MNLPSNEVLKECKEVDAQMQQFTAVEPNMIS
jgi:hypothetical protein